MDSGEEYSKQDVSCVELPKDCSECFRLAFKKRQTEQLTSCSKFLLQNFAGEMPESKDTLLELSRHLMIGECSSGQLLYCKGITT